VVQSPTHSPDFGQADLSNCEREQIHLAGSIQPHGALLILREEDLGVVQVSANLQSMLELERDPLDMRLPDLSLELSERVVALADAGVDDLPTPLRCRLGSPPRPFEALVHRLPEGGIAVELEPAAPRVDVTKTLESTLQTILSSLTLRELCDDTARIFKNLSGYDRVMVYRFDDDGHGEVFAERRESDLEPYLGNRYPASDIPQIARRLYERNRIRIVVDVDYEPVPLVPRFSPITGRDVDMSLCSLRSTSPIHVQYLKNMGVGATLVISLMSGGRLWGLISCHHCSPRNIPYEIKAVCELLAEAVATRIAALESFARTEAELSVRRLEKRMIEGISTKGDWKRALFDGSEGLLQALGASGAALSYEDQLVTTGEVPGTPQLRAIVAWLRRHAPDRVFATSALGTDAPEFASLKSVVSGLVSTPVSRSPGDLLIWFRPERVRTVTWGGNPFKPVEVGDDPSQLSPRRSFSQWNQVVKGTSDHWSPTELVAARMIGESIEDIVYQFRALRILIAQDQLARVRREVQAAAQPIAVLDVSGSVLLVNEAFEHMIAVSSSSPGSIEDLPELFGEPSALRASLGELVRDRQPWRGEVRTVSSPNGPQTWLLRADPVFAAVNRVLGYVLFFTDLTDRKAGEAARRRFQEGIMETHRDSGIRLNTQADLIYRNLLSPVIGNAKLAALEITDGMDLDSVPGMLDSVSESVSRTARLLERVVSRSVEDPEA
jgi:light-regulated signal transduction histidine kinase (bacteriophytochrome)